MLSVTDWFELFDLLYCSLYCVVFCLEIGSQWPPKTSMVNLSSIARFLGCLPVQKWGMGQILDPRRRSRFLHHLSSSSPRSYKASTWSASSVNSQNGGHRHHHHSRWSPASSLNGGWAFTTSSTSSPTTTQHRCTFRFDSTHPNPAVKFCFPWKSFNLETVRRFDSFGPVKKLASGISTL